MIIGYQRKKCIAPKKRKGATFAAQKQTYTPTIHIHYLYIPKIKTNK